MRSVTQSTRIAKITTPLGGDTLALGRLDGEEQMSELFDYTVECISEDSNIDLYEVLGMPIGIELFTQEGGKRHVHGLVRNAAQIGSRGEYACYRLSVTAWPWMLTQTTDCRIFADKSVPDILEEVISDNGYADYELRLTASYDKWHFCVQYQESDFDFMSRLMEHEGIYYFFEHHDDRHVMVLCDGVSAHGAASGYGRIPHYPAGADQARDQEHLVDWQFERNVTSGKYVTKDFGFDEPGRDLLVKSGEYSNGNYQQKEVYDFPGGFSNNNSGMLTRDYGKALVERRLEGFAAMHEISSASGNVRGLQVGNLFELFNCERRDQNREYLVLSAHLSIDMGEYHSSRAPSDVVVECRVSCLDSQTQYRPVRKTRKPEIRGPQTAIVVGPAGEEIHTDEHGRVKLQFHWDRYGKSDESSSCWVRVSQSWAGEKWGSIHIPRMGQEVIVEYIDGDPDRPIVTGRVYNGARKVPYDLPANATQSGIKSRSSKGGKPANFNEIRMEDKKGEEELYLHAEKNQKNIVENDELTSVGHNRSEDVGNDESIAIGNDRSETVGNNESISISNDRSESVGNNENISIGSNRTESVADNESISVGSNRSMDVGGNQNVSIGKNSDHNVAKNRSDSVGADFSVNVSDDQNESTGKSRTIDVGKILSITAADQIVLKTGKASITMKKDGTITISGKDINLKASGAVNAKASKNVVLKGKKVLQN